MGDSVPANTVADIENRILPFGELCLAGDRGGVGVAAPVVVQAPQEAGQPISLPCPPFAREPLIKSIMA